MPRASRAIRGVRGCMRCAASRCPSSSSTTRRCRRRRCGPARGSSRRRSWPRWTNAMRSCCPGLPVPIGCNEPSRLCSADDRYASPLHKDLASTVREFRLIPSSRSTRAASSVPCRSRMCSHWRTSLRPSRSGSLAAIGMSQNALRARSRACCSVATLSAPTEPRKPATLSSPLKNGCRARRQHAFFNGLLVPRGPQTNAARRGHCPAAPRAFAQSRSDQRVFSSQFVRQRPVTGSTPTLWNHSVVPRKAVVGML